MARQRYAATAAKIAAVAEKLRALPELPAQERNVTKAETVRMLRSEIEKLQGRGYTLEQIANTLRGEDLDFTSAALRSYLQRDRKASDHKTSDRKDKKAGRAQRKEAAQHRDTASSPDSQPTAEAGAFAVTPDTRDI